MKQVAKEAFENNMDHHDTPKTISEDYLNNQECSNQILLVLKIRRIFPNVYFVNTNPTKKIAQFFFLKKNLANYQAIDQIFSRNQILIAKCNILQ